MSNKRINAAFFAIMRAKHSKSFYNYCDICNLELQRASKLIIAMLFAIRRAKQKQISLYYCAFCNLERKQMQISLYLLCLLQFGELKIANKLIFTVLFTIWRDKKCK